LLLVLVLLILLVLLAVLVIAAVLIVLLRHTAHLPSPGGPGCVQRLVWGAGGKFIHGLPVKKEKGMRKKALTIAFVPAILTGQNKEGRNASASPPAPAAKRSTVCSQIAPRAVC
jgi:hypothetical protein